jgi:hypothetical protein
LLLLRWYSIYPLCNCCCFVITNCYSIVVVDVIVVVIPNYRLLFVVGI